MSLSVTSFLPGLSDIVPWKITLNFSLKWRVVASWNVSFKSNLEGWHYTVYHLQQKYLLFIDAPTCFNQELSYSIHFQRQDDVKPFIAINIAELKYKLKTVYSIGIWTLVKTRSRNDFFLNLIISFYLLILRSSLTLIMLKNPFLSSSSTNLSQNTL